MRIDPYRRRHPRKTVVFVDGDGAYITEHGDRLDPLAVPENHRCFCTWETARRLTIEGRGEALLWKGEHIRWNPVQRPDATEWVPSRSDAYVIRVPMYESTETNLSELARWRDWLHEYGAQPGTPGGASMGLLKGTLRKSLWCSVGWDGKRIRQSAGGRIANGPGGPGTFDGDLFHYDLQAAYANGIGTLRYGGRWFHEPNADPYWLEVLQRQGVPIFVHASVYVPKRASYGPLPCHSVPSRLRRHRHHPLIREMMRSTGNAYPVGRRIQGWWALEEIQAAQAVGATIKVLSVWKHSAPKESPFRHWLAAVNLGREMQGLAGSLAKVTGNALWGQFALDPSIRGKRTIRRYLPGRKRPQVVKLAGHPFQLPAIDLAEIVAGRIRARLLLAMLECGNRLVCAHTDGLWAFRGAKLSSEWRVKATAHRVDLLTPQKLRYFPQRKPPVTVYSGVPLEQGAAAFDRDWSRHLERSAENDTETLPILREALRVT
jgi:hypothetical protein